jgi:hypothetical protein
MDILRHEEDFVMRRVLNMEGVRVRGCPRSRWMECMNEDLIEKKLKRRDATNRQ